MPQEDGETFSECLYRCSEEELGVQSMVRCLLSEAISRIEQKHKCKAGTFRNGPAGPCWVQILRVFTVTLPCFPIRSGFAPHPGVVSPHIASAESIQLRISFGSFRSLPHVRDAFRDTFVVLTW